MVVTKSNYSIDHFHDARTVGVRKDGKVKGRLLNLRTAMSQPMIDGSVMEFGVWRGKTTNRIAQRFLHDSIWAFDSFEGLPEDWHKKSEGKIKHRAGHFALTDKDWPTFHPNVRLVKGWFKDTLPVWIQQHHDMVKFLHVDCDLYSSTATVLQCLESRIRPGTIVVFDEFYPWNDVEEYPLWHQGEYLALQQWVEQHDRAFEVVCRSLHQQVTVRISR